MTTQASTSGNAKATRTRWRILAILFIITTINYADRATISIAGPELKKLLGLSLVQMGFVFSAFAWSYVLAQLAGGWLLDRFGSKIAGFATDLLVRAGATVMFSETTEVRDGIDQLTARAVSQDVADAMIREMAWYDDYLRKGGVDRSANTTPVIKVATRDDLARRWHDLMDVNAGRIATGEASIEQVGWELFRLMLDVASGRKTWAEHWKLHNALTLFNPAPIT